MKRWISLICAGVAWSWAAQAGAESLSEGLLLHYPFDADGGHLVADASGNAAARGGFAGAMVADGVRWGVSLRFQ